MGVAPCRHVISTTTCLSCKTYDRKIATQVHDCITTADVHQRQPHLHKSYLESHLRESWLCLQGTSKPLTDLLVSLHPTFSTSACQDVVRKAFACLLGQPLPTSLNTLPGQAPSTSQSAGLQDDPSDLGIANVLHLFWDSDQQHDHTSCKLDLPAIMELVFDATTHPEEWEYFGQHAFDLCCESYAAEVCSHVEGVCTIFRQLRGASMDVDQILTGAVAFRALPVMKPYICMLGT